MDESPPRFFGCGVAGRIDDLGIYDLRFTIYDLRFVDLGIDDIELNIAKILELRWIHGYATFRFNSASQLWRYMNRPLFVKYGEPTVAIHESPTFREIRRANRGDT